MAEVRGAMEMFCVLYMSSCMKCTLSMHTLMSFIILTFCFLKQEIAFVMSLKPVQVTSCAPGGPTSGHVWEKTLACHSQFHSLPLFYTTEYHFPPTVMAEIKKTLPRGGEHVPKWDPQTLLAGT